jgi:uncharacterized NAD-dependent epimerase/dehydratase family protein
MIRFPEGKAIVYCEGAFATTNGKTAHGLVRRCLRYRILSVIDSSSSGQDAGEALGGKRAGIPILSGIEPAVEAARRAGVEPTHLVVGLAPEGGRLDAKTRQAILSGIRLGLSVDCGLHDYLSEDYEIAALAEEHRVTIRDVRKPPETRELHFFSGKIEEVESLKVAVLGTDSAVGKRTTAWMLVDALREEGLSAELVGTGQTAWLQGGRHTIVMDALPNDFVSGEIEHAVWEAWNDGRPDAIVIEGQGSLLNPAYPGGYEIIAAARPDVLVLQHAPAREHYDGFPQHPMHPLSVQIEALELISDRKVAAIVLNTQGLEVDELPTAIARIEASAGRPVIAPMRDGVGRIVSLLRPLLAQRRGRAHG